MLNFVKQFDVVVDGPFIEELRDITLPFRGSSNQRIIKYDNNNN
jgi:anaerobic ribonucleoside-triphosphate reductase activating protein